MNQGVILNGNTLQGLEIARSLGELGVEIVTFPFQSEYLSPSKYVSRFLPPHSGTDRSLEEILVAYGKEQKEKPVLFPTERSHVKFMIRNEGELSPYYLFPGKSLTGWREFFNGDLCRSRAMAAGIPTPEEAYFDDERLSRFLLSFPLPLLACREDMLKQVPIRSAGDLNDLMKDSDHGRWKVLRRIVGPVENCYTFCGYYSRNTTLTAYGIYRHLRHYPREFGKAVLVQRAWEPEIYETAKSLVSTGEFHGYIELTFKKDEETSTLYLLSADLHPGPFTRYFRIQGGLDFSKLWYLDATKGSLEPYKKFLNFPGKALGRQWPESMYASFEALKIRDVPLVPKRFLEKKIGALYDSKDPGPALTRLSNWIREYLLLTGKAFLSLGGRLREKLKIFLKNRKNRKNPTKE